MNKIFTKEYINNQIVFVEKCKKILKKELKTSLPLFFVHSYGCQGNVSEGEKIKGILKNIGFFETNEIKKANIIILNTCAIREKAQEKVFSNLGNILKLKLSCKNENKIVGVCGCMVQQKHVEEKLRQNFKEINLVFGPHVIYKLPQMLFEILSKNKKKYFNLEENETIEEGLPVLRNSKIKALVPIRFGCNNVCS